MNKTHSLNFHHIKSHNHPQSPHRELPSLRINDEKVYSTLDRQDFDINTKNYWAEICTPNPPVRRTNHVGFLYDGYYYIFGGRDINQNKMNDMYKIRVSANPSDKINWEKIEPKIIEVKANSQNDLVNQDDNMEEADAETVTQQDFVPEPVAEHKGVLIGDKFYVYGGIGNSLEYYDCLYVYDIIDNKWSQIPFNTELETNTSKRSGHSMSVVGGSKIVIFGGFSNGKLEINENTFTNFCNDIIIYDINENVWEYYNPNKENENEEETKDKKANNLYKNCPEPRINHSQVTIGSKIIIYGGMNESGKYFGDMWEFDTATMLFSEIEIAGEVDDLPKARQGHTALMKNDTEMYIFGGKTANIFEINEFWKFDFSTKRFKLINGTLIERDERPNIKPHKPKVVHPISPNPYQTFYKLKKVQIPYKTEANNNHKPLSPKQKKEDKLLTYDAKVKLISNSLIFKIDREDFEYIENLNKANRNKKFERVRYGHVPLPRDGHSAFLFMDNNEEKMFVFGGDRNKYPFNELFMYDFVREREAKEREEQKKREEALLANQQPLKHDPSNDNMSQNSHAKKGSKSKDGRKTKKK